MPICSRCGRPLPPQTLLFTRGGRAFGVMRPGGRLRLVIVHPKRSRIAALLASLVGTEFGV